MSQSGFNPNSRWDRHIPETDGDYTPEWLNEKIDVLAYFKAAKIYPRSFTWNSRRYRVKTITYTWQERRGQEQISFFSVRTRTNLYQISFNNKTLGWRIDKVID
jgi:hypothetical protein